MTVERDQQGQPPTWPDRLCSWARELDACDGYLVMIDGPFGEPLSRGLGPLRERDALEVADELTTSGREHVRIVRFHRVARDETSVPRPRRAG